MVKELGIRSCSLPESICSGGSSNLDAGEDEEFYERIEAPKFVDFTVPDHYRPDDHYWFCLRVGCEQNHEEEMDSEKIYKDFVLRVMAARSPNVRLQKALSRNASRNMKCPMTVPSKCSKSRVPRLAVASSISRKLGYEKDKVVKPPTNPMLSTPKVKTRQVAAKYLTTPRSKKRIPDADSSFRSVQNPKPTFIAVPKNRMVAKALAFHSPKKAIILKKSVELRTPLTKLCEGMKRLEITSQKKRLLAHSNRALKEAKNSPLDTTEIKSKTSMKNNSVACQVQSAKKVNPSTMPLSTVDLNLVSPDAKRDELDSSKLEQMDSETNDPPSCVILETKEDSCTEGSEEDTRGNMENMDNSENHSTKSQLSEVQYNQSESTESTEGDDKENVVSADENRPLSGDNIQTKILGEQINTMKKIVKPVEKNPKGSVSTTPSKFKKPKPTNPKPFRLRTDERSILKESNSERKGHYADPPSGNLLRKHGADTQGNVESLEQQNKGVGGNSNSCSLIKGSRIAQRTNLLSGKVRSKTTTTTPKRPNASTSHVQKPIASPLERSKGSLRKVESPSEEKVMSRRPCQKLGVINENSSKVAKSIKAREASENGATGSASFRSSSRGKRQLTVPKEPRFHTTHVPRSCTRKLINS